MHVLTRFTDHHHVKVVVVDIRVVAPICVGPKTIVNPANEI